MGGASLGQTLQAATPASERKIIDTKMWRFPYAEARKKCESEGYTEISIAMFAKARQEQGLGSEICDKGAHTTADFLFLPGKSPRLTKSSIISAFPQDAVPMTRAGGEFWVDAPQYKDALQRALEHSLEINVNQRYFDTAALHKHRLMVYAFGTTDGKDPDKDEEDTRLYGEFLRSINIVRLPLVFPDPLPRAYVRKAWLSKVDNIDAFSALSCFMYDMNYARVRGIRMPREK